MILILLQIACLAVVGFSLYRWKAGVLRRNTQSWESLVAQLRLDSGVGVLSEQNSLREDAHASPEEQWKRINGAHGLWAMHQNARVMLEMADYAARNSDSVDRELLASLRSDAMQIRVSVAMVLVKYAFSQVNEGICMNAYRAASMYAGMTARMTDLLEAGGGGMVPSFGAAM